MKKNYIEPSIEVVKLMPAQFLAASGNGVNMNSDGDVESIDEAGDYSTASGIELF